MPDQPLSPTAGRPVTPCHRKLPPILLTAILISALALPSQARDLSPGFFDQSVDLPGMPAAILSADMTGDGIQDLVILVAYRTWDDVSTLEQTTFDGIEGMVEVMTVVTAQLDKRELRVFPGRAGMGFDASLPPLELDTSVHALATGHPAAPLIAITDQGIAAVHGFADPSAAPSLASLLDFETSLTGSGSFYSDLAFLQDLDGDEVPDLVLPTVAGWAVFGGTAEGFRQAPFAVLTEPEPKPGDDEEDEAGDPGAEDEAPLPRPRHRIPEVRDVSGDGRLDLVVLNADRPRPPVVYPGAEGLRFGPPIEIELGEEAVEHEEIVYVGDLDGDGSPELVSQEELEPPEDAGWRQEVAAAKRPRFAYRLYRLDGELGVANTPHHTFEAVGYTFEGDDEEGNEDEEDAEVRLPGGFQDLNGDGRLDLVAVTLDFSLMPMLMRILVTGTISLRMDFHPWCQQADGSFSEVPDLDLSGKFKINLRKVRIKHLSQFAGDFNGDGRADFVQLGRGRKVTIHQGGAGCSYPQRPDRTLKMAREPEHLGLVRILDLDGNRRSDIYVVQPSKTSATGEPRSVRLDLYLTEDPSRENQGAQQKAQLR